MRDALIGTSPSGRIRREGMALLREDEPIVAAGSMHDRRCFVQFLHPGGEHHLAAPGIKAWTRVEEGHGRKFLCSPGRSLPSMHATPADGELGFWGEWEAPS